MRLVAVLLAAGLFAGTVTSGLAATFYVAPLGTKLACAKSDGTQKCPWLSVDQAIKSAKGGDTILLMDGTHGVLDINKNFDSMVTIRSQNGRNAHIEAANFTEPAMNIRLASLKVWRTEKEWAAVLVRAMKGAKQLEFDGLEMRSRADANNHLKWTADRWLKVAGYGFDLRGSGYIIRNNTITGVRVGIVAGYNSLVENNVIDGFCGDGIRGFGKSVIRNNLAKNRFKVDSYHADGFQSHTTSVLRDLTIESNTLIEWAHPFSHPLRGYMQGIGMFDGFYENVLIQNNVIAGRASHGIAVYGARGLKILNNTVINVNGVPGKYPIIRVKPHKNGTFSENVVIANNLAMGFDGSRGVTLTNNKTVVDPAKVFADVTKFDYTPRSSSGFIDKGLSNAPKTDVRQYKRPAGTAPDIGAFEANSSPLALRVAPMTMEAWLAR
jgi:hypothetical protein